MSNGTGLYHSAAGTRGYVLLSSIDPLHKRSEASITINDTKHNQTRNDRTWWTADDFDDFDKIPTSSFNMLPCDSASFNLGEVLYKDADDAVPGAMRVRASRCGSYSYQISFPVVLTGDEDSTVLKVYEEIQKVIKQANYMMAARTSIQTDYFCCLVEQFSISVDGYGGANPVSCKLSLKGISENDKKMNNELSRRSMITNTNRRDKGEKNDIGNSPINYGGRLSNIKDCALALNNKKFSQIVSMELNIQNEFKFLSTASGKEINNDYTNIISSNRVFLLNRKVTGSFKFLSSASLNIWNDAKDNTYYRHIDGIKKRQWASPLWMYFGGNFSFFMPAIYWQPRVEEFSTGSPLVSVEFMARSNVKGLSEFKPNES